MLQCTTRMQPQDVENHKDSQEVNDIVTSMLQMQLKRWAWQQSKEILSRICATPRNSELYRCCITASGSHCQYSGSTVHSVC